MKINMLTTAKSYLSSWKNLLAVGTLLPLGGWIYSRVWMVNPAILGDEYVYSVNARKALPWDPSPMGELSNYLFHFVYQSTNLCGEGFYACGKVLNIFFFLGFVFTLFLIGIKFVPFWVSYGFMIASALSPLNVYTSMFLPESMYMFFIGLILVTVLRAIESYSFRDWLIAGAALGVASLVKPHAWLSAIAVFIVLIVIALGRKPFSLKLMSLNFGGLVVGAVASRVIIGFVVAGPRALGFFGQYLGFGTIEEVTSSTISPDNTVIVATSPLNGVVQLFLPQFNIHLLVMSALMALAVVLITSGVIEILRSRTLRPATGFALFAFIWLFSMMIEIVVFTGWVTGGGDDHTTRVLLRYYEFLYVIVPLAGLAIVYSGYATKVHVWIRWILVGVFAVYITPAFTGFFATLTIQIADAPTLAGLVVNLEVFNAVAIISFASLLLFATFPKYTAWAFVFILPASMIATGWQIQEQYISFRGQESSADKAGKFLRDNFTDEEIASTWIAASSRFEATNIAIWADGVNMAYELFVADAQIPLEFVPADKKIVVASGNIQFLGEFREVISQDGFKVYLIK